MEVVEVAVGRFRCNYEGLGTTEFFDAFLANDSDVFVYCPSHIPPEPAPPSGDILPHHSVNVYLKARWSGLQEINMAGDEEVNPVIIKRYKNDLVSTHANDAERLWNIESKMISLLSNHNNIVRIDSKMRINQQDMERSVAPPNRECNSRYLLATDAACYPDGSSVSFYLLAPSFRLVLAHLKQYPQSYSHFLPTVLSDPLCQLLTSVKAMHDEKMIAHMSLSLDEILLSRNHSDALMHAIESTFSTTPVGATVTIIDFEFAREFGQANIPTGDVQRLILDHMRPSALHNKHLTWCPEFLQAPTTPYLPAYKDLWDLGLILFEVYTGCSLRDIFGAIISKQHYSLCLGGNPAASLFESMFSAEGEMGERNLEQTVFTLSPFLWTEDWSRNIVFMMIKFLHPEPAQRVRGWDCGILMPSNLHENWQSWWKVRPYCSDTNNPRCFPSLSNSPGWQAFRNARIVECFRPSHPPPPPEFLPQFQPRRVRRPRDISASVETVESHAFAAAIEIEDYDANEGADVAPADAFEGLDLLLLEDMAELDDGLDLPTILSDFEADSDPEGYL